MPPLLTAVRPRPVNTHPSYRSLVFPIHQQPSLPTSQGSCQDPIRKPLKLEKAEPMERLLE